MCLPIYLDSTVNLVLIGKEDLAEYPVLMVIWDYLISWILQVISGSELVV